MSEAAWAREVAADIVKRVLVDLQDRSGFDHWWADIDEDIQIEIEGELTEIVTDRLAQEL